MGGEGNKKEVYLGYDTQDEREVAVTLVKTHILTPQQVDQIRVGAESMSTVGDQVAAPLYLDVGEDQGYIYMISAALEYIEERILNPNFLLVRRVPSWWPKACPFCILHSRCTSRPSAGPPLTLVG